MERKLERLKRNEQLQLHRDEWNFLQQFKSLFRSRAINVGAAHNGERARAATI
jgi:hypothetical protein